MGYESRQASWVLLGTMWTAALAASCGSDSAEPVVNTVHEDAASDVQLDASVIDTGESDASVDVVLDLGADTDSMPDQAVERPPDPVDALVRFVGFGLGTFVCNGSTIVVPVLAERGKVSNGYELWNPGTYHLVDQIAAAMSSGAPCSAADDFTLSLLENGAKTVILGFTNSFLGPPTLTDDLSAPTAGEGRVRVWGRDRIGTGNLTDVEYCVNGQPLAGGSSPSTPYIDMPAGSFDGDVRIADGTCGGALRDTFSIPVADGEVRSLFAAPGTKLGPARGKSDVFIINCLDSVGGTPELPSSCKGIYATAAD